MTRKIEVRKDISHLSLARELKRVTGPTPANRLERRTGISRSTWYAIKHMRNVHLQTAIRVAEKLGYTIVLIRKTK